MKPAHVRIALHSRGGLGVAGASPASTWRGGRGTAATGKRLLASICCAKSSRRELLLSRIERLHRGFTGGLEATATSSFAAAGASVLVGKRLWGAGRDAGGGKRRRGSP